jgi:DNA processing protein
MEKDLLYQVALAGIPYIGPVQSKILIRHFGEARAIFSASRASLEKIEGIGKFGIESIAAFKDFRPAEKELAFIKRYDISPLFFTDKNYPKRLLNYPEAPVLLFYKGNADLNASKIISIVGTRRNTDYGKQTIEKFIRDLMFPDLLIVSGLAFGIDAIAHKTALKNHLPTVGVLAHGLDMIYPLENTGLAREMVKQGGLLTQFSIGTKPDKYNFPIRNRVVAAISDATIVVETGLGGGSLITAKLANQYDKNVFAIPGRITDPKSAGCNWLIQNNNAILLHDAQHLIQKMGWEQASIRPAIQPQLPFPEAGPEMELSGDEKVLTEILRKKEKVSIDELNLKSRLSSSAVAAAILNLELRGAVSSLPGKIYRLHTFNR